jgi:hypothetical protein
MNVAFKGVHTISDIAVSAGHDPGPVTEGHVSDLFEFAPSDSLACALPISASMVDSCGRSCVSRQSAQQGITKVVHLEADKVDSRVQER